MSNSIYIIIGAIVLCGGCSSHRMGCDDSIPVSKLSDQQVARIDHDRLQADQGFVIYPEKAPRLIYRDGSLINTGGRIWVIQYGTATPATPTAGAAVPAATSTPVPAVAAPVPTAPAAAEPEPKARAAAVEPTAAPVKP